MLNWVGSCRNWYALLLRQIIPSTVNRDSEESDHITILVNLALLAIPLTLCFVAEFAYFGLWELAVSLCLAGVIMVSTPWIFKKTGSFALAREGFIFSLFAFKIFESIFLGSVVSPGTIWFIALPVGGILLGSRRSGISWFVVSIGSLLLLHNLYGGNVSSINNSVPHPTFVYTFSLVFLAFCLLTFVLMVDVSRKKAFQRVSEANKAIRELATRDPLTGTFNRRYVWEHVQEEERRALSDSSSFYVCMIDLDRFKQINDTLGHPVGDKVLQAVARAIEGEIREGDCFGRYGGEEFILILKGSDTFNPAALAERLRERVAALRLQDVPGLEQVTVSIGVAQFEQGEGFSKTLSRADRALYSAKASGRNRVMFAEGSNQTTVAAA